MSKQPKKPGKTTFVRNTEQKIPKVLLKTQQSISKREKSPKKNEEKSEKRSVNFDEPQPNSSKNITEKINIVKNLKTKDLKRNKDDLIEEKITKRMNFPADRPIYKDLIPLGVKRETAQIPVSRNPLPPKDIEPCLSDFYQQETLPEFIFQVEPEPVDPGKIEPVNYDGFKITKHMKMWENVEYLREVPE